MASRMVSTALDLSRLPAPNVIEQLDFEALRQAFIDTFVPLIKEALGIEYDVDRLRTSPAVIIGEAFSYLRLLDRARVNDAARAVLLPFSTGTDLDNLGSFFGVDRAEGEDDASYRARISVAPDAYSSAGTAGSYIYYARTAAPLKVKDVGVRAPSPGTGAVLVSILSKEPGDGTPSHEVLQAVRGLLYRYDIKPLTADLTVQAAIVTPIDVALTLQIPPGPDPSLVRANAEKAVRGYAEERHRIGRRWRWKGLVAAAKVPEVEDIVDYEPADDVDPGPDGAVFMNSLTVNVEVVG